MFIRLLELFSSRCDKFLINNSVVWRLFLLPADYLGMASKQFFINLEQTFLKELKVKSAEERRSLNSLARKIFDDLPKHRELLLELGNYLRSKDLKSQHTTGSVGLTFRITEEEFWDWKEKALLARMNPRELTIYLLELWYDGELESILQSLNQKFEINKENVVKRIS